MNDIPMKVLSTEEINRLAERVLEANRLRAEGRPEEEILQVEPSMDEMKAAIAHMVKGRKELAAPKKSGTSTTRRATKQSLDELLGL